MKQLTLKLCLLIFACTALQLSALAQTTVTVIKFDFATKKFIDDTEQQLERLKTGDFYRLEIYNINTNQYKVTVGKRDTVTSTALAVPTFPGFGAEGLNLLVSSLSTGKLLASAPVDGGLGLGMLGNKSLMLGENWHQKNGGNKASPETKEIERLMGDYEKALRKNYARLDQLKTNTEKLINDYNKYLIQSQIEHTVNSTFFKTSDLTLDDLYNAFNGIRANLISISDSVTYAEATYTAGTKPYTSEIQNTPGLKEADANLSAVYTAFVATLTKAREAVSPDNAYKFITSIVAVTNNQQRKYTSFPLQFNKDQNILVISATPRKDESGLSPYSTSIAFPLKHNDFWGVSSGIFFSTLYNRSYSTLRTVSTAATHDTTYSIVSEQPSKIEFGVNAMIRHGWKDNANGTAFQVGFGPGVTVSDKVRPRVLLGLGIAQGKKKHKFIADIGTIVGYTEKLSVLYKENTAYPIAPSSVTVSKLNFGGYISIGYLFN